MLFAVIQLIFLLLSFPKEIISLKTSHQISSFKGLKGSILSKSALRSINNKYDTSLFDKIKLFLNSINKADAKISKDTFEIKIRNSIQYYFESWNKRDMISAIKVFSDDCIYEDTLYPKVFYGKEELEKHLVNVAQSLPTSFEFIIDNYAVDSESKSVGVQWHVEANKKPLLFTRGSSMYVFNDDGLIIKGFDVPEPVIKSGGISLELLKFSKNIIEDPKRIIPLIAWLFYCWYLFISDLAPGINALQLDPNTWQSVIKLSVDYLVVFPTLFPNIAPTNHPILEGVFNIMLLWATLFFGFITDGHKEIPLTSNVKKIKDETTEYKNDFLPILIGMQLLTNAFYLPYLVNRIGYSKNERSVSKLLPYEQVAENIFKSYSYIFIILFTFLINWMVTGRPEYGSWNERYQSFIDLASSDRLSFSFLIDLIYFSIFQGWLIDDDFERRDYNNWNKNDITTVKSIGKYFPFFGLLFYFSFRPNIKNNK